MESSSVKVYLRMRPVPVGKKADLVLTLEEQRATFHVSKNEERGPVNHQKERHDFRFDGILGPGSNQDEVFRLVALPVVQSAIEGFNGTVFAFGQTGSGKTYTITGGPERYEDRGIIPRAVSMVFRETEKRPDTRYDVRVSYLEIYNEFGYDLLHPDREVRSLQDLPRVFHLEGEDGKLRTRNLSVHKVENEEEALNVLFLGDTNRIMSETPLNMASTRSHCIFTIMIESRSYDRDTVRRSKLNIVDLAGSERVSKNRTEGEVLHEAKYINLSLHHLERVILALQQNDKDKTRNVHVPYRNSLLTLVLKDSLGGNCLTTMIATASSEEQYVMESISTCRFAQRVALVQNEATLNEEEDAEVVIVRLRRRVTELEQELSLLQSALSEEGEDKQLNVKDLEALETSIRSYVEGTDELSLPTVTTFLQVKQAFRIFREVARERQSMARSVEGESTPTMSARTLEEAEREIDALRGMLGDTSRSSMENTHPDFPETSSLEIPWPDTLLPGDRQGAFEHFCKHHPNFEALQGKLHLLKDLYHSAGQVAEAAAAIRSEMGEKLAAIGRSHIVQSTEGLQLAHGNGQGWKEQIQVLQSAYMEKHEEARSIKHQITHVEALLGQSKRQMQVDFERWLLALEYENSKPLKVPSLVSDSMSGDWMTWNRKKKMNRSAAQVCQSEGNLPPDVLALLTGHPEADADILRFYRAKLQLEHQS